MGIFQWIQFLFNSFRISLTSSLEIIHLCAGTMSATSLILAGCLLLFMYSVTPLDAAYGFGDSEYEKNFLIYYSEKKVRIRSTSWCTYSNLMHILRFDACTWTRCIYLNLMHILGFDALTWIWSIIIHLVSKVYFIFNVEAYFVTGSSQVDVWMTYSMNNYYYSYSWKVLRVMLRHDRHFEFQLMLPNERFSKTKRTYNCNNYWEKIPVIFQFDIFHLAPPDWMQIVTRTEKCSSRLWLSLER